MSESESGGRLPEGPSRGPKLTAVMVAVPLAAAAIGGFIGRALAPSSNVPSLPSAPGRPIVQIVRQPSLPSVADAIDRLCPSVARIIPASTAPVGPAAQSATAGSAAFVVSADGWLLAAGPLPQSGLKAEFGDGRAAAITDVHFDPVSGLAIAHADLNGLTALTFADQVFGRVGDFGFSIAAGRQGGCSARSAMIGSNFLTNADRQGAYLELQPSSTPLEPGSPFFAGDGALVGVATGAGDNSLLPAPIASTIVAELIRNDLSPIVSFGFRAVDFSPELAARMGDARLRGAGVALVQPQSGAAKAGLQPGDIVIAVDDSPVSSASELSRALDGAADTATLRISRGDQQLAIKVPRTRP